MRILLTGAHPLNLHLAETLLREGHGVTLVAGRRIDPEGWFDLEGARLLQHDLTGPLEPLLPELERQEIVIHAAGAQPDIHEEADRVIRLREAATLQLLSCAPRLPVRRWLFIGPAESSAIPLAGHRADETAPFTGEGRGIPETEAQFRANQAIADAARAGLDAIILQTGRIIGPRDARLARRTSRLTPLFRPAVLCPPGGLALSDVTDLCDAIVRAIRDARHGDRLLVANGNLRFDEIHRLAGIHLSHGVPPLRVPLPLYRHAARLLNAAEAARTGNLRGREQTILSAHQLYYDCTRARQRLDWRPRDVSVAVGRVARWLARIHWRP